MRVETQAVDAGELDVDVLGVPVTAETDDTRFPAPVRARLAALVEAGDVRSDVGATTILHLNGELAARRLAAVGVTLPRADRNLLSELLTDAWEEKAPKRLVSG